MQSEGILENKQIPLMTMISRMTTMYKCIRHGIVTEMSVFGRKMLLSATQLKEGIKSSMIRTKLWKSPNRGFSNPR